MCAFRHSACCRALNDSICALSIGFPVGRCTTSCDTHLGDVRIMPTTTKKHPIRLIDPQGGRSATAGSASRQDRGRGSDRGALNRSTSYERLSRPKWPREVSDEAFEQEAAPSRGGGRAKLRQADEALAKGMPIAEVARSLGVSEVALRRWRTEYGAVDRDAVRRMKELEKENARLERLEAERELDILILNEVAKGEF